MESRESSIREPYKSGEKSLSKVNVKLLLGSITDFQDMVLIQLALATGIRREDIVRIRQADINVQERSISFNEQKKRRIKTVYVSLKVMTNLQMLMNVNRGAPFLFPGGSEAKWGRGHISGKSAYNKLQKWLAVAGLELRPFHALRATCIKLCQAKGWPSERTAEHVGDTIQTIQYHYLTPSKEEMQGCAEEEAIL